MVRRDGFFGFRRFVPPVRVFGPDLAVLIGDLAGCGRGMKPPRARVADGLPAAGHFNQGASYTVWGGDGRWLP